MITMTPQRFRKKWKELGKKFKQEYRKISLKPSGSRTDDIYEPTLPFYDQLQFLQIDHIRILSIGRELACN